VIEDSLNGVRAGLAAGMQVWRFTGGTHLRGLDLTVPEDARPHATLDRLDALCVMRADLCRRDALSTTV
jgi:beta-phosphoglucomutase-like phosphatase (HAD superfamily)